MLVVAEGDEDGDWAKQCLGCRSVWSVGEGDPAVDLRELEQVWPTPRGAAP